MNMTNCSPIEISNLEISDLKLLLTPLPDPHPTLLSAVNCSVYITVSGVARCIYIYLYYTQTNTIARILYYTLVCREGGGSTKCLLNCWDTVYTVTSKHHGS